MYSLVNDPAAFDNFVAASPSIWFENRMLQKPNVRERLASKLRATQAAPRVLITVGEYEQIADPDFPAVRPEGPNAQTLKERAQVNNAREFSIFLAGLDGIDSRLVVFPGEDQGTVIQPAISHAVRFALAPTVQRPRPPRRWSATAHRLQESPCRRRRSI